MADATWDVDEALAEFTPSETIARVCFDGKLTAAIDAAEMQLANLDEADPSRAELAGRIVTMTQELQSKERSFRIAAIGDLAWSELVAAHPPTDDDAGFGYNQRTFPQAVVAACCVDPKLTLEQATKLRSSLATSQWRRLWVACQLVNVLGDGLGKSASGLATTLASETKLSIATAAESPTPSSSAA